MKKVKNIKILLCSPINIINCGISRWTNHILDYYQQIQSEIILEHYYPILKGVYSDTSLLKRIWLGFTSYVPFLYNLNKKLKTNEYDVLHFISSSSIALFRDLFTLRIAKSYNVKTVIHFHFGRIPDIYNKGGWEYKLIDKVIKLSDTVIVIDKKSFTTLQNKGYVNIELLPNPLAINVGEIIELNKDQVRQQNKIIFAGQVLRTKGVYELIEACKQIENINLKMIGYVSETIQKELLLFAGERSSEWLEFSGEQEFSFVIQEMLSAAVFVLPSYTEGFPNVIIESMACGCPIVSTTVGAIPEMLDIENGFKYGICVPPKDVEKLKEAIEKMLKEKDYAISCGVNAKERVFSLYSMPSVWKKLEAIWIFKEKISLT